MKKNEQLEKGRIRLTLKRLKNSTVDSCLKLSIILILITGFPGLITSKAASQQVILTEIAEINTGSKTVDVHITGDILYALDDFQGLKIYNVSDPENPALIGRVYDSYTFAHAVVIDEDQGLAYIADFDDSFEIVDLSDLTAPKIIGRYDNQMGNSGGTTDLSVAGKHVFLASQYGGLEIIDIEDPNNPVEVGSYYAGNSINSVSAINDSLVCINEVGNGFKILDTSDLGNIIVLDHYPLTSGSVKDFVLIDSVLYVSGGAYGFLIFDISDPSAISKTSGKEFDSNHYIFEHIIKKQEKVTFAFLCAGDSGLIVLDVSDPLDIKEIVRFCDEDNGKAMSLSIQGDLIYVADFEAKLEILEISGLDLLSDTTSEHTTDTAVTASGTGVLVLFSGLMACLAWKIKKKKAVNKLLSINWCFME
ncbi:MAG: LVIVD repeat-containing protein [Candidatus Odinarchaeota archaeon]